ncbi:RluA family pseudouridine synthase [Bacillus massiliglaciei]|uniref:RluA family pseudouridine synthase n=1 Tax=Bacillus massiliglaciei TaxID=1816693 RepID=UPI000B161382|nr:RluA family pseudouridine synthase [Bacillus massiliglaciei]
MSDQQLKKRFKLNWTVEEKENEMLLRDFLSANSISRRALTDIKFKGGLITLNGSVVNVRERLRTGDRIELIFPREIPSEGLLAEDLPIEILFEDSNLLVIHKPAGMTTIPSREHPSGSLANALAGYYKQSGLEATIHIVTRLDRDTSGLILVAKHRHIHHLLSQQQKTGLVKRRYQAIAEGIMMTDQGKIEEPIGRKPTSIIEREVRNDGQYACTYYSVAARTMKHTHLEIRLKTGRTHQIRVHMSHAGHPLAGDDLYGGHTDCIKRQALHCCCLDFIHPVTHQKMQFTQEIPEDMRKLLVTDRQV